MNLVMPISTDHTQLIVPAPRCSLCGRTGDLYHQCPDNVDTHTSDSDDEIPEIFQECNSRSSVWASTHLIIATVSSINLTAGS